MMTLTIYLALVSVKRLSRSNIEATIRQPSALASSSSTRGRARRPSVAWITSNAMSDVASTIGRLARRLSCWATRTSLERVEIAMPTQIDQHGEQRREEHLGEHVRPVEDRRRDRRLCEEPDDRRGRRRTPRTRSPATGPAPPAPCRAGTPRDGSVWSAPARACPAGARRRPRRRRRMTGTSAGMPSM